MKRLTILFLLTTIQSFGQRDAEINAVYSTIINEELRTDTVDSKLILILNTTFSQQGSQSIENISEFIKEGQPIICNYADSINELIIKKPQVKNLILHLDSLRDFKGRISADLKIDGRFKLVSRKRFENSISIKENRQKLLNTPGFCGLFEFSRIVFSGDYAAVYCGQYIRPFNAVGTIMVLKKENGKWKIVSRPEMWVS